MVVTTMAMETSVTVIRAETAESAKPEVAGFGKGFLVCRAAAFDQVDIGSLLSNAFLLPKLRRRSGAGGQGYDRRENENTAHTRQMVMPQAVVKGPPERAIINMA
jgi:hypothetical protein